MNYSVKIPADTLTRRQACSLIHLIMQVTDMWDGYGNYYAKNPRGLYMDAKLDFQYLNCMGGDAIGGSSMTSHHGELYEIIDLEDEINELLLSTPNALDK